MEYVCAEVDTPVCWPLAMSSGFFGRARGVLASLVEGSLFVSEHTYHMDVVRVPDRPDSDDYNEIRKTTERSNWSKKWPHSKSIRHASVCP